MEKSFDAIMNAALVPVSEVLSKIIEEIVETVRAANNVLIEKESFSELSSYLERTVPVLKELTKKNIQNPESLNNMTEILQKEIKVAKQLTSDCTKKNRFYLLVNCRRIVKRIEDTTKEISRAISLIPLSSLDLSSGIHEEISKLCDNMLNAEFKASVAEEEVLEKIESAIRERNADCSYVNNLLLQIAEVVGIPTDGSVMKEFEGFKREIEDALLRKDFAEAMQMEQIIALIGDAASSRKERETKYYTKRNSLGNQALEPLQPFYCPITHDVMVDPVETLSGQTFERSAIEKWFADGNTTCPSTMIPLTSQLLRPNITLRKSIEEWKDRNTMISIASMRQKLCSDDEQEMLHTLNQLQDLCEERDVHREWVALEGYIPLLVGFLNRKKSEIRTQVLTILCSLAKDNDDNKEIIAAIDHATEYIVRSLARRVGEGKLAVALLLELSKNEVARNQIGKVQGCIFLLVTMLNSDDTQAAKDASELLENLQCLDQNVIDMAKNNYFKPLLERLCSGPDSVKMTMTAALAGMELTDHSKSVLFEGGALKALLDLILHGNVEAKKTAVKALQNLSTVPSNGLQMIKEKAGSMLLDLLHLRSSTVLSLRELAAATLTNLAIASTSTEASGPPVELLNSDDDIFRLFSLINLTGPGIQQSILRTFRALCKSPSAVNMRAKLRQCSAVQVLVQHCESSNLTIRANSVKLFFSLTEDGDNSDIAEHVSQRCLTTLLNITQTSGDDEERAAAMGILSNLPTDNTQFTQWLLDAGALPTVVRFLAAGNLNASPENQHLIENAAGALNRFTIPDNIEWQRRAAVAGVIPVLVRLLSTGTALIKCRAAVSLAQFSMNSIRLSRQVESRRRFMCFSAPADPVCPVHGGVCSVESSFCLVEADGVEPLVRVLGEADPGGSRAALQALATLMEDVRLQGGSKVIDEAKGVAPIIRLLGSESVELQEAALRVLERMFRQEEFKRKYSAMIQMPLVDITQRGNATTRSIAARTLAHLNVLHDQSSYF